METDFYLGGKTVKMTQIEKPEFPWLIYSPTPQAFEQNRVSLIFFRGKLGNRALHGRVKSKWPHFSFLIWKNETMGKKTERERKRHQLNLLSLKRSLQGLRPPVILRYFPRLQVVTCIRSGAAETQTSTHMGCWCCRHRIYPWPTQS